MVVLPKCKITKQFQNYSKKKFYNYIYVKGTFFIVELSEFSLLIIIYNIITLLIV